MGKHYTHDIHANSAESFRRGNVLLGKMRHSVMEWLRIHGPATDREVKDGMGFDDMNPARWSITTLKQAGFVKEIGSQFDEKTERNVRVSAYVPVGQEVLPL
jgi:hypothetical protein